jgi:hypothetical protein
MLSATMIPLKFVKSVFVVQAYVVRPEHTVRVITTEISTVNGSASAQIIIIISTSHAVNIARAIMFYGRCLAQFRLQKTTSISTRIIENAAIRTVQA